MLAARGLPVLIALTGLPPANAPDLSSLRRLLTPACTAIAFIDALTKNHDSDLGTFLKQVARGMLER